MQYYSQLQRGVYSRHGHVTILISNCLGELVCEITLLPSSKKDMLQFILACNVIFVLVSNHFILEWLGSIYLSICNCLLVYLFSVHNFFPSDRTAKFMHIWKKKDVNIKGGTFDSFFCWINLDQVNDLHI